MLTIAVSGPQATGKTTLALAVGRALTAPVFSRDPIMEVLQSRRRLPGQGWRPLDRARRRLDRSWVPATGLEIQTALLTRQLKLGQPAVLECVAPVAVRQRWRQMSAEAGHAFLSIECVCSDPAVHRARFERRLAQDQAASRATGQRRTGRSAAGWDRVVSTMRSYEPDEHADFVADAMRPVEDLVADLIDLARSRAAQPPPEPGPA